MNSEEINQKFGAIVIAIQNGKIDIARKIFDISLEEAIKDKLIQAIRIKQR